MSGKGRGMYQKGGGRDEPGSNDEASTNQKRGIRGPCGVVG